MDLEATVRFVKIAITLGFACLVLFAVIGVVEAIHIGLGGHD